MTVLQMQIVLILLMDILANARVDSLMFLLEGNPVVCVAVESMNVLHLKSMELIVMLMQFVSTLKKDTLAVAVPDLQTFLKLLTDFLAENVWKLLTNVWTLD